MLAYSRYDNSKHQDTYSFATMMLMDNFQIGLPGEDWDKNQQNLNAHILQGAPWARFQEALGRRTVWAAGKGWSWLGIVMPGKGVGYLYAPYGPTAINSSAFKKSLACLIDAARQLKVGFIRCEPLGIDVAEIKKSELKEARQFQPKQTVVINLNLDESTLRSNLTSSHRNTINSAGRRGIILRSSTDISEIDTFLDLTHKTFNDRHIRAYNDDYYKTLVKTLIPTDNARFFTAEFEGKVISSTIALDYLTTRTYAFTGNDPAMRKLRASAPLVWKIITDSKADGYEKMDLWGIAPLDAGKDHPWSGFSEFKRSFGGDEVSYNGTWELPISKLKYKAYTYAKRIITRK